MKRENSRAPDNKAVSGYWSISVWKNEKNNSLSLQKYVKDKYKGSIQFFEEDIPFIEQVINKYKSGVFVPIKKT